MRAALYTAVAALGLCSAAAAVSPIVVNGTSFALNGNKLSYRFHVDETTGDLVSDHFGASVAGPVPVDPEPPISGWIGLQGRQRREFPDHGRGDFRIPAVRIHQAAGHTVSELRYESHKVVKGKPALPGLPATFGDAKDVTTLVVQLYDNYTSIAAELTYSIFPKYDAVVRSASITNKGKERITVEALASMSVDFAYDDFEMLDLRGDWGRETQRQRRKVDYGVQR